MAGETTILALQTVFALGEKSNMGSPFSLVTSRCLLWTHGICPARKETIGLYLCLPKLLYGKIHQMACTFIAQGFVPVLLKS